MEKECQDFSREFVINLLEKMKEINHLKDVYNILDRILKESRKLSKADAGSIFLIENEQLRFSFVHNDTLFRKNEANAELYADFTVPIDTKSIVGYVAKTGQALLIDDAYSLPDNIPYAFNPSYDERSGYRTHSILCIPLKTLQEQLVGVMQLINAKDQNGQIKAFSPECLTYVPLFANNASVAIERAIMNRELILRMMKMAELRDPAETGAHVQRVGAYASEIYMTWAQNKGVDQQEIKKNKDIIRLAAMLHDVGKVGISDAILKKPAKLTTEEFETMKWHTVFGARLFVNTTSDLDKMSREIALNHHEKFNGQGYPGALGNIMHSQLELGPPKKGHEIPISARISAIADVFDALSSRRSYKEPWPDDKILSTIEEGSGTHFDPDVVEAFFQILNVIKAIRDKYKDTKNLDDK